MTGHIFIEGEVGWMTTPQTVRDQINAYPEADSFEVHFNSPGGDVYDGYQIGVIVMGLSVPTVAFIEGQCASIATYIAMCCGTRVMFASGDFTIHDPTGTIHGGADDFRQAAERLDRIKNEIINRYLTVVSKKGVSAEDLDAMMRAETSMSPDDALKLGFVDEVRQKLKAVAKLDNLKKFLMETPDKNLQEQKTFFESLEKKFNDFFKKFSPKNEVPIVLADGTPVTSDAATPDAIVGSTVTDATGAPLADGDYETQDGFEMEVQGGKVTAYDPLMNDQAKQIEQLKQQLAQAQAQNQALTNQIAEAKKGAGVSDEFKKEFANLKKELTDLKTKTFGNPNPPNPPDFRDGLGENDIIINDEMAELGESFIASRPHGWVEQMNARAEYMNQNPAPAKKKRKVVVELDEDEE